MKRTLLIALSGIGYFIVSLMLFLPFRMMPVKNYNLVALPLFAGAFLFLLYKACTASQDSRGYLFGFFAGMVMWQLFGEIPSIRVPAGAVIMFSDMNIKVLGGYFYVTAGWILLGLLWKLKMLNSRVAFVFMIFLGIWSFELYMDNYSARVPMFMMGIIANTVLVVFLIISIYVLYLAKKTSSVERKTVLGGVLYLTLSIVLSTAGWKQPQSFYLKYEVVGLQAELQEVQEELEHIKMLKKQMVYIK
jgi:hypothetical protein